MGVLNKVVARLPKPLQDSARRSGRFLRDKMYARQSTVKMLVSGFTLEIPRHHHLVGMQKSQPYRNLCVGITAKFVTEKYIDATIIDIGANIGDTAAVIAQYCGNKMIVVEASDYYAEILSRNVKQFPNPIEIERVFVSDGNEVRGSLHYRGGTAFFEESSGTSTESPKTTKRLCDIADATTRFLKIDTDGFDTKIIRAGLEWLSAEKPAILFENSISDKEALLDANSLFESLRGIGYEYFIYWDDPGFHVLSTRSMAAIKDLNHYLFKLMETGFSRGISNYDVLCLHEGDKDIFDAVSSYYAAM
jgi:FkbM family methyltransferase